MNTTLELDELIDALEEAARHYGVTKISPDYDASEMHVAEAELVIARVALKTCINKLLERQQ